MHRHPPASDAVPSTRSKRDFLREVSGLAMSARWARSPVQTLQRGGAAGIAAACGPALAADPPLLSSWAFDEGTGSTVVDRNTGATASTVGNAGGLWGAKPGLNSNGAVRVASNIDGTSTIAQILNLASMTPGQTQICVWWTLSHPNGALLNGPLWFCGINNPDPAGSGGWGVRIDAGAEWPAIELRPRGSSMLASYALDTNQPSQKLNVQGNNTRSYCCLVIERSLPAPGHLVLKFYAQPHVDIGKRATQTLMTVGELPNGGTALPGASGLTKLCFFGRPNGPVGYGEGLATGYALCNWGAARRTMSIDNIGARIAKELATAGRAGNYYALPLSASAIE